MPTIDTALIHFLLYYQIMMTAQDLHTQRERQNVAHVDSTTLSGKNLCIVSEPQIQSQNSR